MPLLSACAFAEQTYTSSGVFTDTQTVVAGGKTYTTQTVLTNVDGNVLIGASADITITNLVNAINLGAGVVGTDYATAMTKNTQVRAVKLSATTFKVVSLVPGTIGNLIATTETQTNGSWGAATLAGGTGQISTAIAEIKAAGQINADVLASLNAINV